MALADITLNDGQGTPVAHTFSYIATKDNRTIRSDMAANPETPLLLTFAHSQKGAGTKGIKSHLARIDKSILDADGVTVHKPNVRLVSEVPNAVLSDALADDFAAYIRNWATSANVRAWFRDSVG